MLNNNSIHLYESKKFINPLLLKIEDIDIRDIALNLTHECRFNGSCRPFFSVAEHSLYVSQLLPIELKLEGLLHDGSEYLLKDFPKPVKENISEYKIIEQQIQDKIYRRFGIHEMHHNEIKKADNIVFWNEVQKLKENPEIYKKQLQNIDFNIRINIKCESMFVVEYRFLKLFHYLYKE